MAHFITVADLRDYLAKWPDNYRLIWPEDGFQIYMPATSDATPERK